MYLNVWLVFYTKPPSGFGIASEYNQTQIASGTMDNSYVTSSSVDPCCTANTYCVDGGLCNNTGTVSHDADSDGDNDYCSSGTWYDCNTNTQCPSGFSCVSNDCVDRAPTADGCTVDVATIATGTGADTITVTCTYSDADGYADILFAQMLVNWYDRASPAPVPYCDNQTDTDCGGYFTWTQSTNTFVENHDADGYYGTSYSSLDVASSASCSGNTCTVSYVFSYPNEWIRANNDISMNVRDVNDANRIGWDIPAANYNLFSAVQCIIDSDCADAVNNWCTGNSCAARVTCYEDADGDGFGNPGVSALHGAAACSDVADWVVGNTDCDDRLAFCGASCNPGITEDGDSGMCDTYDNDCDTLIDENTGVANCYSLPECAGVIDCSQFDISADITNCPVGIGCEIQLGQCSLSRSLLTV